MTKEEAEKRVASCIALGMLRALVALACDGDEEQTVREIASNLLKLVGIPERGDKR
jgi:hypothetical protein